MFDRTQPHGWRRPAVLVCALLACSLPVAARLAAGPRGADVHVRWQQSVDDAARQQLEARFRLADPRELEDASTWRYDLTDPSRDTIEALVRHPAVEDTHHIDRSRYSLDVSAVRTDRRQRFSRGSDIVAAADWLAVTVAVLAALLVAIGRSGRVRRTSAARRLLAETGRLLRPPPRGAPAESARISVAEDRGADEQPRLWTAAVLVMSAPFVITLCLTLWQTPFPITEMVALFEDAVEQPVIRILTPYRAYYRPLWNLTVSGLWHYGGDLETTLASIRVLTIAPVVLLVLLVIWHLRPRTVLEAAAAGIAVAVLIGSPGFRDNLEIGVYNTIVPMSLALITWTVLNRERRISHPGSHLNAQALETPVWHVPLIVSCTLVAIGFKEQGLVLVPLVIGAWWTRAPGASRGMAVTVAVIAVAYVALRLSWSGSWAPFEQDVGFGFSEIDAREAAARFGRFPFWVYVYSAGSTMANILFAEPTRGVFQGTQAALEGRLQPWQIIHVGSSAALTGVIAWWGISCVRSMARGRWSLESRVFVAMVLVLLASGALSFNYSRERNGGIAVIFYALAAFFAVRTVAVRMLDAPRVRFLAAGAGLALLAVAWQTRAVATLEYARVHSWGNQREWFVRLAQRRHEYAHRTVYLRILDSMIAQGTDPAAPRPTHFPRWITLVIGQPQ